MASGTVTSPAGEAIEIVDDDDWMATIGRGDGPPQALGHWHGLKPAVIRYLWEYGEITDKSGKASITLHKKLSRDGASSHPFAVANLMQGTINRAAFEREIRGRRTFRIKLVALPERWYRKLQEDISKTFPAIRTEGTIVWTPPPPEPEPIEEPAPVEQSSPVLDIEIASQVAMSLLTTVVEIISNGKPEAIDSKVRTLQANLDTVAERLGERIQDNERLRRDLRQAGDEIHALKHERDGLRRELRATQTNLSAALKGEALTAINHEITKRVDQFMRATPTAKGD